MTIQLLAARSNDGGWIIGLIVVGIWLISAIINAVNRLQQEQQRRQLRSQLEQTVIPPARMQQKTQVRELRQKREPISRRQPVKSIAPPALPVTPRVSVAPATKPDVSATEIRSVSASRPGTSATAVALHGWLQPKTIRQQFILTEILHPPLALREPRG